MNDIINKVEIEFSDLYEYTKKYFKNPDIFYQGILNKNLYENDCEKLIMDRIYFDEQIYKNRNIRCVEFGHYIIGILFGKKFHNKFIEFKTQTI